MRAIYIKLIPLYEIVIIMKQKKKVTVKTAIVVLHRDIIAKQLPHTNNECLY